MSAAHSLPAFFVRDGDRFVATESTRGPWSRDYQHGGPPAALLTRELERLAGDGVLLTRLTFDFLRPVPIARLAVRAETVRAVAMRTAAVLPAALGDDDPGPLPVERATPFQFGFFPDPVGYHTAMEIRVASGTWGKGPMAAWMRPRVALVEGETVSALQRLMIAVDSASGIAVVVEPAHYTFVNADLTVAIHRAPEGEWMCLDAATVVEAHGIGLTRARLWDPRGAFGVSLQSCVAERRATQ